MKNVWGNTTFPLSPLATFNTGSGAGSVGSGILGGEIESSAGSRSGTPGIGFSSALNPGAEPFRGVVGGGVVGGVDSSISGHGHEDSVAVEHRRAPASRANSVRFDETSIQPQQPSSFPVSPFFPHATNRPLTEIAQPSSRYGFDYSNGGGHGGAHLTNQPSSYRSDGRVGTAQSFRTNSFTTASVHGQDCAMRLATTMDETLTASTALAPPPGLLYLGPVPCIIRCWLTTPFSNETLIYGAVCSGSYHSTIGYSLVKKLGLEDLVVVEPSDGKNQEVSRSIKLSVYLPEASVYHSLHPASPSEQRLPTVTVYFVVKEDEDERGGNDAAIKVVLGSDVMRAHNADVLFSQDRITIIDDERNKISIPMTRPEDVTTYNTLSTVSEKKRHSAKQQPEHEQEQEQHNVDRSTPDTASGKPDSEKVNGEQNDDKSTLEGIRPRDFSDLAKASQADREPTSTASPHRNTRPTLSSRQSVDSIETGVSAPTWQRGKQLPSLSQENHDAGVEGVSVNESVVNGNINVNGGGSVKGENNRPKSRASEGSWATSSSVRNWNQGGWGVNGNSNVNGNGDGNYSGEVGGSTNGTPTTTSYQNNNSAASKPSPATTPAATVWVSWRREGGANGSATTNGSSGSAGMFSRTNSANDLPFRGTGGRGGRNMKVLKPNKPAATRQFSFSSSVGGQTGQTPTDATNGQGNGDYGHFSGSSWGDSSGGSANGHGHGHGRGQHGSGSVNSVKSPTTTTTTTDAATMQHRQTGQPPSLKLVTSKLRSSANPIGGASAFGWLNNATGEKQKE
ncbi:hypothetical protein AAP_02300 [Ascosphaera apis ARSEF 7405]|uniref:Ubiquitin carboxyl-terminal hydrolase 19 n=1 Tax=Ascosphaera apis ARSEF 7405 TaxID=392613 RepID=A0A168A627_9EURO|nr:hypothetical protein AAP_02300 [Ascosphaera apis ARSEF 7405]